MMHNQHRKIRGYRELDQNEIDLINRIKELGYSFDELLTELERMDTEKLSAQKLKDHIVFLDHANKDIKQGVMWAIRSIALPD